MRDIQTYLRQYQRYYQSRCDAFQEPVGCSAAGGCACKAIAEVWAYTKSIVPEEYSELTIQDYVGITNRGGSKYAAEEEQSLTILANKAKRKIWEYCWGKTSYEQCRELPANALDAFSVMDKRFRDGTNLVIHGTHYDEKYDDKMHGTKRTVLRKGKTLLATIVLKEAIRRKMFKPNKANSFQYMPFPIMRTALMDYKNADKMDMVTDLEDIDWLLIDDITAEDQGHERGQYKRYLRDKLDSFLMTRLDRGKPTIFVLNFNINNANVGDELGYVMEKICTSASSVVVEV